MFNEGEEENLEEKFCCDFTPTSLSWVSKLTLNFSNLIYF